MAVAAGHAHGAALDLSAGLTALCSPPPHPCSCPPSLWSFQSSLSTRKKSKCQDMGLLWWPPVPSRRHRSPRRWRPSTAGPQSCPGWTGPTTLGTPRTSCECRAACVGVLSLVLLLYCCCTAGSAAWADVAFPPCRRGPAGHGGRSSSTCLASLASTTLTMPPLASC